MTSLAKDHANCLRINANVFRAAFKEARARQLEQAADFIEAQAEKIAELERQLSNLLDGVKISIPTATMEAEFQTHYRRGYDAGQRQLKERDEALAAFRALFDAVDAKYSHDWHGLPQHERDALDRHIGKCWRSALECCNNEPPQNAGNQTHCAGGNGK